MELFHITNVLQTFFVLVAAMIGLIGIVVGACCATIVFTDSTMNSIRVNVHTVIFVVPKVADFSGKNRVAMIILEEFNQALNTAWFTSIIAVLIELTQSVLADLCKGECSHGGSD